MSEKKERIAFFDTKPYDRVWFDQLNRHYHIKYYEHKLTPDSVSLAQGCRAVIPFVNDTLDKTVIDGLCEAGVEMIALRCAGYNNVDRQAAAGRIAVTRVPGYSPYAVAEFTMGLLLTLNRKIHKAYFRTRDFNFSLNGLVGFDLHGRTVGVIGTGVGGVLGARKELRGQRLRSITYVSIGAVGGIAGAALLLSLDPKIFEFAVPPLILFSSLIIAVNPRGRMQARQAAADVMAQARSLTTPQGQGSDGAPASALASTQPMSKDPWWIWLGVAFVAVYSGYFGAGSI